MSGSGNRNEDINLEKSLTEELKRIEAEMEKNTGREAVVAPKDIKVKQQKAQPDGADTQAKPKNRETQPKQNNNKRQPQQSGKAQQNHARTEEKKSQPKNGNSGQPKRENAGQSKQTAPKSGDSSQPRQTAPKNGNSSQPRQTASKNGDNSQPRQTASKNGNGGQPKQGAPKNGNGGQPKQGAQKNGNGGQPKQGAQKNGNGGQPKQSAQKNGNGSQPKQTPPKNGNGSQPKQTPPKNGKSGQSPNSRSKTQEAKQPQPESQKTAGKQGQEQGAIKSVPTDTIPIEIPQEYLVDTQESFESKIERAMQQIVKDTVGDQQIKEATKSHKAPKAKKAKIDKERERILQERQQKRLVGEKAVLEKIPKNTKPKEKTKVKPEPAPVQEKKKTGAKKVAGITAAVVLLVAAAVYGGFTYYYHDKFFQGTQINGLDCSGMTVAEAEAQIADAVENYAITIKARGQEPQSISGQSIDYQYMADDSVKKLMDKQSPWKWITGLFGEKEYTASENITYNKKKLLAQLESLNCAQPENQEAPQNAYISFQDTQFQIVPETPGATLDKEKAFAALKKSVGRSKNSVDFHKQNAYTTAEVKQDNPTLLAQLDSCNNYARASITYTFGDQTEVLDGNTIKDWLTFDESGQMVQDEEAFRQHAQEYVAGLAQRHNTVGKERNFHTTSGRDIVVGGGNYGWQINQEAETEQLIQEIKGGQVTSRAPIYSIEGLTYAEDDIGNTYIEVDLSNQHMYYYQDGVITFDSDFVSGNMSYSDRQTPSGVCRLYYKKRDEVLRGKKRPDGTYEYESPVDYWMPFNGGVGFHDANWRGSFGGSIYQYNGSHGCINLPPSNAAILYEMINTDVPIVVFY